MAYNYIAVIFGCISPYYNLPAFFFVANISQDIMHTDNKAFMKAFITHIIGFASYASTNSYYITYVLLDTFSSQLVTER